MTNFRTGHFLVSLAFVSMCSACAGTGAQDTLTETERLEKIAEARQDQRDASMRWNMVVAKRAEAEARWGTVQRLAQTMFDANYEKAESGYLLGKALGQLGNPVEQVVVYRKVRKLDAELISDEELLDALVAALDTVGYNDIDERLDLRLQIARFAPSHPTASRSLLYSDMLSLADLYYRRGKWEQMLELVQSIAATPLGDSQVSRSSRRRVDYMHAVALWKNGRQQKARQKFEEYLAINEGATTSARRLSEVIRFYDAEGEGARIAELYERSLGDVSSATTPRHLDLYLDLANRLLATGEPDDRKRGKAYLLYYLDVSLHTTSERRRDNVYNSVRRVASRYQLTQLAQELTQQAVATGAASRYTIERLFKSTIRGGDKKRARQILEDFLKSSQQDSAVWYVADWAREVGEYELAYRYMKKAVAKYPERGNWWYDLAQIALKLGKKKEAARAVGEYLDRGRTSSWDVQSASRLLQQAGMKSAAVDVLADYLEEHPGDTRTATYLAGVMLDDGQRERALKMLEKMADTDGVSRYQLMDLAHYVGRTFGRTEAFELYLAAGERGDDGGFIEAASIAVANGQMEKYDTVLEKFVETSSPRFYEFERLWYVLQPIDDKPRKLWLLEKMIAARGSRGSRYRGELSRMYLEMGKEAEALALWDDANHAELRNNLFLSQYSQFSGNGLRAKFLEQFHKSYPDGKASAWMLFLVGEQHYGLYLEESRGRGANSDEAKAHLDEARKYYLRTLDKASARSSVYGTASKFFVQRNMSELAEQSLVRSLEQHPDHDSRWYEYAEFLLEQGRIGAAEQVFLRYVQEVSSKETAILAVAKKFGAINRDDKAESFYKMAMACHEKSNLKAYAHRQILEGVGDGLGGIYLKTGRVDEFLELTDDFYAKYLGQHRYLRPHDRTIDLQGLQQRGLWKEYVARLEQLPETQDQHARKETHAKALWYMGERKAAWKLFNDYLSADRYDNGYRWLQLAEFLESRGGEKLAATAYDRAVRQSSRYRAYSALMARAEFLVKQGHYRAAIQDFFKAANTTHYGARVAESMRSAFRSVGREELAVEAAQRDDSPFTQQKAVADLAAELSQVESDKPEKLVERVKELAKKGANSDDLFRKLVEMEHYEVIAALIEERLQSHDFNSAARLMMAYANELASIDRLDGLVEKVAGRRISIDERGLDTFLVDYYLQSGQPKRSLDILRQIGEAKPSEVASLELYLGEEHALSESVSQSLLGSSYSRRDMPSVIDFIRFGQTDLYASITERAVQIDIKTRNLGQAYVADLLYRRGVRAAIAYLRRTANKLDAEEGDKYAGRSTLVGGMSLLAASGYIAEVRGLIEELPKSVREHSGIENLSRRLTETFSDIPAEDEDDASQQRLNAYQVRERAQRLLLEGRHKEAEAFLLDAIGATFGKDPGGRFKVQGGTRNEENLFRQLLGIYAAQGNREGIARTVELWKASFGQDNFAVDGLIGALEHHGLQDAAAQVAREAAETYQTGDMLEKAIVAAARTGDRETVEALLPKYWRQLGLQGRDLGEHAIDHTLAKVDPKVAVILLEPYRKAMPDDPRIRLSEIIVALRAGQFERGRELIGEYIDDFSESDAVIGRLVSYLNENDFDVESARVVAPRLSIDEMSAGLMRKLAEACAHIGRYEDAERYLKAVVDQSVNPELSAAKLSYGYTLSGHLELGEAMAKRAFAEAGTLGQSYLARGLWRLASGQKGAQRDIERGFEGRQIDLDTIAEVATVALQAERHDLAEIYLTRLLRAPKLTANQWNHPLHLAIDAVVHTGNARWGVAFFDRTTPGLLDAPHLLVEDYWAKLVGSLLTEAGLLDRAERWYASAQNYELLWGGNQRGLHELLNARAINLAINGGDPRKAVRLSRQAIASSTYRRPTYFLTLALAYRRSGDEEAAAMALERAAKLDMVVRRANDDHDDLLETLLTDGLSVFRPSAAMMKAYMLGSSKLYNTHRYVRSGRRGFGHGSRYQRHRRPQQPIQIYRGTSP